jgi:hypothetical protein
VVYALKRQKTRTDANPYGVSRVYVSKTETFMRRLLTFLPLLLLGISCRDQQTVVPLDATVSSLADLPADYQPVSPGLAVAGRLKSENQNGQLSSEWRYNGRGQLLEWRHFGFDQKISSADQYRYDAAGKLRFVQHFDNDCGLRSYSPCTGAVVWTSYDELTTDPTGRVTESRTYLKSDGTWALRSSSRYAYNPQGQMTGVLRYDAKQVLILTQTLTYDTRGNVVAIREQTNTTTPNLADRTFVYAYDTGRNPYANTVYFTSAFFLSPNTQAAPGLTYEYRADGLPVRIRQNGATTELAYY